jgi:DNA-binding CsgD family transcriptional regulator/PAS domain-containing protein
MISLEAFSELLEVLYAAPLHPGRWGRFLDLLCEHTRSRSSFLICADSRQTLSIRAQGGVPHDPAVLATYAAEYSGRDPLVLPLIRSGSTGVLDCEELLPRAALVESDVYRYLNAPAGYRYPGLMALTCTLRRFEAISFWRSEEEGYLNADSVRLLEMLFPHVQSAMEIRQALGTAEARATGAEAMADASTTPTFLLSTQGAIQHCNEAARELLAAGDGLVQRNGFLRAADAKGREPLQNLLKSVGAAGFSRPAFLPARALSLNRISGLKPLQLLASPVPHERDAGPDATLLLLVTDPEKPIYLRDDLMRDHYSLTTAETEIANGLLTGYSLDEIAALRHVSVGTVRYQLKSIFGKTGTGRQSELVRLLMNLPHPPSKCA